MSEAIRQAYIGIDYAQGQAPRVTEADVAAAIVKTEYVVLPDGRTTIAMLTLDNGFTVRGESSCVCVENFDYAKGEHYALEKAKDEVWQLLGFRLADQLWRDRVIAAGGPIGSNGLPADPAEFGVISID